jgi:hypothetical protein
MDFKSVWEKPWLRQSARQWETPHQVGLIHAFRVFLGWMADGLAGASMTEYLDGIRLRQWPTPRGLRRLVSQSLAQRSLVSYEILEPPPGDPPSGRKPVEKRSSARRRVRLSSAKLLDAQNKFICECLVRDLSTQGLCLKLMKNIGLPARCHLYDDETGALNVITTIWRRGSLLGVRYCPTSKPVAIRESDRAALRGRYYAVLD